MRRSANITLALIVLLLIASPVSAGSFRHQKKSQRIAYRPMRWTARANAGYPVASTAANVTGLATGIPVALAFNVIKFIARRER